MNIPVVAESEEMHDVTGAYEQCIFCNEETKYWHEESNRPVCPVCSVVNTPADIVNAPYGY